MPGSEQILRWDVFPQCNIKKGLCILLWLLLMKDFLFNFHIFFFVELLVEILGQLKLLHNEVISTSSSQFSLENQFQNTCFFCFSRPCVCTLDFCKLTIFTFWRGVSGQTYILKKPTQVTYFRQQDSQYCTLCHKFPSQILSRPGRSQGLFYEHCCISLIHSVYP